MFKFKDNSEEKYTPPLMTTEQNRNSANSSAKQKLETCHLPIKRLGTQCGKKPK